MRKGVVFKDFTNHLNENFWFYTSAVCCIVTGIIIGVYAITYMSEIESLDLKSYFIQFTQNISTSNVNKSIIFISILKNNIPLILSIIVLGLTVIGMPIILIIDILKGFTIGFTTTFLISTLGAKGIGMVLLVLLPQNIIYLPCLVILSVIGMKSSFDKLKRRESNIAAYSTSVIIVTVIMLFGFLYETFIAPGIISYFIGGR